MNNFANISDIELLFRPLTLEEKARAETLIPVVCDELRAYAVKTGKDLDKMISEQPTLLSVAKSVTVDVVGRTLMTSTDSEPMTQESQSAGGYSWSGSYLVPGGGLFIKNSELKRLGLKRQRMGVIELYEN